MFMDRNHRGDANQSPVFLDTSLMNSSKPSNGMQQVQCSSQGDDSPEDLDFCDGVLKYISHILMEEDVEDKSCMFRESAVLQATEKSFSDIIQDQYPAPQDLKDIPGFEELGSISDYSGFDDSVAHCPCWNFDSNPDGYDGHHNTVNVVPKSILVSYSGIETVVDSNEPIEKVHKEASVTILHNVDTRIGNGESVDVLRGKKNPWPESESTILQAERSNKQFALYTEPSMSTEMFDTVLLCSQGRNDSALRKELNEVSKTIRKDDQTNGSDDRKRSGKKKRGKRDVVDLAALLTLCAQAVAGGDRTTANDFLKQIRRHATPTGDGMQRLAHYFAFGLEARLAGSGTEIYTSLINMPTSAADILKAYHIYLATCPFRKISNFFANRTIMNVSEKATRLHIIDFGILYGFQWPSFLQRLSSRPGGAPRLRVTGIDLPCPGFRPLERVEETGRRLASYAETFRVPFEFTAIAQKWETITVEDLKLDEREILVVNCLYRFGNLLDETVVANSPRNIVLNLIRKTNPSVFVLGIVNGAYNAPFFFTRFREALFHYSSFFDMLDANIPREINERMLLEKTLLGWEAMNVIACEGAERIERPETYKQWQVRNTRAGFEQLPLDKDIVKKARNKVEGCYHKDFMIDEDGRWLLQGWKGRIVYALSSWRPAY